MGFGKFLLKTAALAATAFVAAEAVSYVLTKESLGANLKKLKQSNKYKNGQEAVVSDVTDHDVSMDIFDNKGHYLGTEKISSSKGISSDIKVDQVFNI